MTTTKLLIKLRDLHEELAAIHEDQQIDDQMVEALGQLVSDIGQLVDRAPSSSETNPPSVDGAQLMDRIMDLECQFETQHPRISQFLSQLTDVLAMMGI